ncbi:unnamed protein product [Schistosoma rodhaini]|uniref:Chorein N-terminal domain-containing protein n=1 Tax=Schistosoma rodhaini TaxID=6188 RepID=A0AA85FXF9_9TREM|nr:unnamed protein product [Schistosoma rodhaini]
MQRYFRLETYVGKLLMSYLNKYVKLHDDQFSMSIWDGDLILTQLDLRLDFLEDIIPFPVNFRSGCVRELRIHVPWTKLNSECIVITLNTVECTFGLKKPDLNKGGRNEQNPTNFVDLYACKSQQMPTNVPPGYLEVYIHRLLSNIHFVVHNLNLKFIEEDLVLSLSLNKADCFVTDFDGNPIFSDINPRSTNVTNRLVQFFDLTVCLDRAGRNGYVEVYEDPIAYRFSMSCFIQIVCTPNASSSAVHQTLLTNLKIHCETLSAHISPVQIPLLCRLIEVFSCISTETFDWSILDCSDNDKQSEVVVEEKINVQAGESEGKSNSTDVERQSWASWVWSFVPSIIPVTEDSDESDGEYTDSNLKEQYTNTDCVKELIQCILEDASEHEIVSPLPTTRNSSESPSLVPAFNTHHASHISDPHPSEDTTGSNFQLEHNGANKEEYLHLRRRRIRRLRRSVSLVPVFVIGIFVDKINLDISLPCPKGFVCSSSNSSVRSRRVKSHFQHSGPGIKCEFTNIAFQTTIRDIYFSLVQLGIRGFNCYPIGCICCCGQSEYSAHSKHDSFYSSSLDKNKSCVTDNLQSSLSNTCATYDDCLDKVRPNFISLGCHTNLKSSASELGCHSCEIFYSAALLQSNCQSTIHPKTTQKFNCSPILTLSDYSKYLTDENVRGNYPALWFDSVRSLHVNEPHITAPDFSSVHQMDGVQMFIHNRFLIGSYSVDVSPNLMHRLEGFIIAYKNSIPYPSCSISQKDEMFTLLPSNLSLTRFSQHISTCNTRFDVSNGSISVHTSHNFQVNHILPCLQLHIDHISLYNRSPIYPYDIVHIMNRQNIPSYLFKRSYEFIQLELNNPSKSVDDWLNELHVGVPNKPCKEWNKQLIAYCYNRTILKSTGICMNLIVNHQMNQFSDIHFSKNAPFINKDTVNDKLSILKCASFECIFWSLNYPHLWNSPSISHSEYRVRLDNGIEINISLQTVGILSFILSDMFHQLNHLKTYWESQDKNVYWPSEHQYCLKSESQSTDKKCWIWTTKLNGVSKFRVCFTKLASVIQISLETNVLMYLNCSAEQQKICPIVERIADKNDSHENKMKPLFCLAVQFPYSHDAASNTPIKCHGYLANIDCLITAELFEWFALLSLPDIKNQAHYGHNCEYISSPNESTSRIEVSMLTKKNQLLYDGLSLSGSDISSRGLIRANIIHSSLSTDFSPTHSLVIGNKAQWKEVWKRLIYCKNILHNATVQILLKPARIFSVTGECPASFSAFVKGRKLEELMMLNKMSYLLFGFPQLYLSNYYDLDKSGNDESRHEQIDDIVLSNCSWSCAVYDLPMFLQSEKISTEQPIFHWMFSATQMYLILENSLIFAGRFSINLDFHHNQDFDSNILKGTSSTNTICNSTNPFVINLNADVKWDREPNYLSGRNYRIPDFRILNQAVKTIQFCYSGFHGIIVPKFLEFTMFMHRNATRSLSAAITVNPTTKSTNLGEYVQNKPIHFNSPSSICITEESCVNIPTVLYKTNYNPHRKIKGSPSTISLFHVPCNIKSYSNKSEIVDIGNLSICQDQDNPFDIILQVQCSLPCTNGEIMLTYCDHDAVLQWRVENTKFNINLQKEYCCVDFHVRYFDAVIKTQESKIPLLTLLEKDIQPIQLLRPYFNKTHEAEIESQTMSHNLSTDQHYQFDKSLWFEENNVPLIPINARKRRRLNSNTNRVEDKSSIGENFIRIVFTRTCSKCGATSDYFSVSQSDLSLIDDTSHGGIVYPEDHLHVAVQPLDIVIIPAVISEINDFINNFSTYEGQCTISSPSVSPSVCNDKINSIAPVEPALTVHSLPDISVEIDSFRLFYLLGGISKDKNIAKHPNALMLSCDFIQAKQLVENCIDRPYFSNDFTLNQSFPIKQSIIGNDRQFIVIANCINITAVPFDCMCHDKQVIDYNSSNSNAIAQNPAKDWNRTATYSDIDDPPYGWSIVHSFSVSVTFAPAVVKNSENCDTNIYGGYSMELSLMNNLLVMADCELIKHLIQLIPPSSFLSSCASDRISQSSSSSSSHQSSCVNLFERLFFSSNNSNYLLCTPSCLFITAHQMVFLMWTPIENNRSSEFTVQINQPHMIVNIAGGNSNIHDSFEFSVNSFQMDCRKSGMKSSCTGCESVIINKFIRGKCNREPDVFVLPCLVYKKLSSDNKPNNAPICSSSIFWYSGSNVRHSRTDIMKPCLLVTCARPSRFDYLSEVPEPLPSQHNRFKIQISTAQDQFFCVRPDTISSVLHFCTFFHRLYEVNHKNVTSEINNCNNTTINHNSIMSCSESSQCPSISDINQPSSPATIARLIHVLHFYFDKINVEINCIKISLQFNETIEKIINSFGILELTLKQISTLIHFNLIHSELFTLTTCWQKLSSLSLIYYHNATNNTTNKINTTTTNTYTNTTTTTTNNNTINIPNHQSIHYLIWPNTSYQFGLSIHIKHCIHKLNKDSNYIFDQIYGTLQIDSGLYIHLPVYGYIHEYIKMIINKIMCIIKSTELCNGYCCLNYPPSSMSVKDIIECNSPCIHCSNNDPIIYIDDLRNQENFIFYNDPSVTSSLSLSSYQMNRIEHNNKRTCQFELFHSHPYWPWILNQNNWKQTPLLTHSWPLPNEVIIYNDLLNNKINIEESCDLQKPQWLSITWMYNELRTPNYLKVFPVPLELVPSKLNDNYSSNGLELQCYLQYWDPFCLYSGNFVTYTVFALSDSQINQYMLSKNNQQGPYGPISSSPTSSKGENNHVLQSNGLVTRSSSNLNGPYGDESVHSSEPPTQPAAAVWRILVDLRVRTSSTTSNPSVNENYPIALARLTPMILIGAIQIDTMHYPNHHIVGHNCLFRCQISNIKISLIENQSAEHQNVGGFELGRCNLKDLDFLYKSNLSSFKNIHCPGDESIQFEIDQFSLLTADVNWSRMQQTMINNNLICCLSKQKLDILCKSLNIFISSDRLISLMILNKRIQQYISEFANILFQTENYQSSTSDYTTSNNNSNLGWTLINYSNQFIVLDQLPLVKYLSANKTNQSSVEVDNSLNELFHVFVKPRQSVYWRPIVFPGPITSSGHAFRIKLRIGITSNNRDNKVFLWSYPVELPWPLSMHKQHNDILCALSLKWEETVPYTTEVINGTFQFPELYLIICCTEPSGLPGKIILHSNVVVRNLLPVCLTCSLSTSTNNSLGKERSLTTGTANKDLSKASNQHKTVDKNSQFTQQLFQIPTGPTMEFISTSANISPAYKSTHGCDLCICFRVNNDFYSDNQVQENNTLWSDPLNFKIPLPDQLNSQTETSHRTLIQLTLNNENNTSTGSSIFYAVITVEYYTTSFITQPICIITISPLFEILNCIPIPLKLESKAIIPQQIINSNSSSIEIISPALFNHENWLTCQHNKNIRDLSTSYLHVLAKPIRLAYHYNLLLTGTLPNGESVFSHPIQLTGHEILKKLATTYMNYNNSILKHNHNNNSDGIFLKKSIQLNNSLPIISTLGIIPKFSFVNNPMNDYLDYLRNDNERKLIYSSLLQYSLRIVLRSQLLLINCSGIDLHLKVSSLSDDCSSYTDNNCEIPLQDNKCLVLSKTQRHVQLGVLLNNEIFWSETITIQPLNPSNEPVEDNQKKNIDKDVNLFLWNNHPKYLSFTKSYSTISINILIKDKMLCLTIELKSSDQMNNDNDEDYNLTKSNNFIITIKPRFYIQYWSMDYIPVRFKPIIIPLQHGNNSEVNNLSVVPISALKLNEVIEISKGNNDNIPILWWNLSHTIDKSLFNTELLYCMQITLASFVQSPWSEVFPLHRVPNISHNKIHRNSFSSMPIFLSQVSIPIVLENSALNVYPSLLITTIEHKSTGQIIIQVDKNSILQNLNPFSIHIYNYTNSSIYSVELLDQLLSSSAKDLSTTKLFNDSMRNILKNTFLNWYPHKIYANSQLSIIPQCLLELLYMDKINRSCNINDNNNTEGICLNFLHPSQFTKLELNLNVQQNDDNVNPIKDPIHINLKELCSSIHQTKGLWEKEKLINDHLLIRLYFSMNENSFGLIIQLIDNNNNHGFNQRTIDQLLSPTINSFNYLNKIHLIINQFCTHLIIIKNQRINQKNQSLSNNLITKYKLAELLPPRDEFIRLTIINLSIRFNKNSILINDDNNNQLYNQYFIINKQLIIEICLKHLQLDNWYHSWTNEYDFPVIIQTIQLKKSKTICQIIFNSLSLLTFNMFNHRLCHHLFTNSSPIITWYLYPPNLDVYLEDSLIYDILGISNNLIQILTTSVNHNHHLISSSLKPTDQSYFLCNQLSIDSFKINLSLHAMLRLYLSCHSAPLHFTPFKLINIENGYRDNNSNNNVDPYHQQHDSNILSGSLIYWDSVKYLLTMHYITQILFRSGWLVGSLDLLGNVTGLLYSLINGLNDLIHLRSSNEDDENKDGENVTMIHLSDTNLFIRQQNIDFPSSTMAMSIGPVASDSTTFSLKYNRNVGFLYRLTQGLSSLTRRTTGGLLLSISGIASSLARNLDYLSFDPHYEQHQDHIRRHHTPKGFSEGIQQGISSLGLCLLSAIAGVADQPLQAIFKTMDNTTVSSDNIFNSSVDNQSTPNFLLSTLGGFGRGLVGVVTKPVAGAAELIAQTSKGLLHGTNNSVEMIIPSKYGEPYVSSEIGLRLQYQNVDVMILNYWGSIALRYVQSNISTSNYYDNQELSICSWFTTEIYNHNNENYSIAQSHVLNDTILWISASLDQNIVYASVITNEIDNSYFSWFKHFPNEVLKRFIDKVIRFDSKFVEIIDKSVNDKLSLVNAYNTSESDMSNSLNNWPFGISISDSWKWIDHIQLTSSNDIDCLKSIIQKFWLIDERLEKSTHQNSTELNSGSLQEQHTIPDSNSVDSKSDMNSADLFSSDRHNSRWKRVREYLIGMSSNDLIHI